MRLREGFEAKHIRMLTSTAPERCIKPENEFWHTNIGSLKSFNSNFHIRFETVWMRHIETNDVSSQYATFLPETLPEKSRRVMYSLTFAAFFFAKWTGRQEEEEKGRSAKWWLKQTKVPRASCQVQFQQRSYSNGGGPDQLMPQSERLSSFSVFQMSSNEVLKEANSFPYEAPRSFVFPRCSKLSQKMSWSWRPLHQFLQIGRNSERETSVVSWEPPLPNFNVLIIVWMFLGQEISIFPQLRFRSSCWPKNWLFYWNFAVPSSSFSKCHERPNQQHSATQWEKWKWMEKEKESRDPRLHPEHFGPQGDTTHYPLALSFGVNRSSIEKFCPTYRLPSICNVAENTKDL